MKYKTLLTLFSFQLLLSIQHAYAFDSWRSYIDGRVDGSTYYLVKETYQKLKYKNRNIDRNAKAFDLGCGSGNEDIFN
ncbi:hypothetical protein JQC92_06185 [Shewanella sp. 202IG2-18]|uniref:hypothetical protein n=1 Tax=Parashewanella hymeniacidonis TaxID=2807618 RepID=UPI0019613B6A|nr:hypothetical protein [Parashewanella hymeniacidonis]MBM7071629.1 hypothetical protein [Parashewanella hymeniacidonis]